MILLIRMLLTVFFIIEMLIILVFTWLVHCEKAHCLNREYLFTSQSSMYKEQKEVILPAAIFIFARILLFFFLYFRYAFSWRIFENTIVNNIK